VKTCSFSQASHANLPSVLRTNDFPENVFSTKNTNDDFDIGSAEQNKVSIHFMAQLNFGDPRENISSSWQYCMLL
jgi:hypothetical protein